MILDSSALVAIALDEPERKGFVAKINAAESVAVNAVSLVEAGIVLSSRIGEDATEVLGDLLEASDAVVIEFGSAHWREAVSAWWRFGKSRHPASLNFGDCIVYATARLADEPLLAKGNEFSSTDIELA
ncbi:MAG: type II toxin-antitoxin system VapC family toxin [Chloroflexota bacterium]|nr:type II toxin-antitoxin system VapC family toxin [Chloroflexota bacterium]